MKKNSEEQRRRSCGRVCGSRGNAKKIIDIKK
jgi:rRNA processing protein Krr1/Pno1